MLLKAVVFSAEKSILRAVQRKMGGVIQKLYNHYLFPYYDTIPLFVIYDAVS